MKLLGGGAQDKIKSLYQIKNECTKFFGGRIVPSPKIYEEVEYEETELMTITEIFLKHEEKYKKDEKIIVGADTIHFAELLGGYKKKISLTLKNWEWSWARRIIHLMC